MSVFRKHRFAGSFFFWASIAMLGIFIATFILHHWADGQIEESEQRRLTALMLADELRQSSDDLTRMARTYVVTGDPLYKARYREIVDIRNGKKPRPQNAYNVYWDLVGKDGRRPRGFGQTRELTELIKACGINEGEAEALKQAQDASDALTKTEHEAMALVPENGAATPENRERAIAMLHDEAYHKAKASVMEPIARFHEINSMRMTTEVHEAAAEAAGFRIAILLSGLLSAVFLRRLWVTIRNYSEKQLEQEARFHAVFENAAVGLAEVDSKGRVLNVNQAFCETFGYESLELLDPAFNFGRIFYSDTIRKLLFGDERPKCSYQGRCVFTEPCVKKDGALVWMNFFVELLHSKNGRTQTYIIAAVDITAEKRIAAELAEHRENLEKLVAERTEKLAESESRFRFIAENSYDVIWTLDLEKQEFLYVSPSVYRLRGVTAEEVMGSSPWEALTKESEEKIRRLLDEMTERWKNGDRTELVRLVEVDQPHKDGHIVHTEMVTSLHPDDEGNPAFVLGVTRDITDRKRAEEEIRRLAYFDGLTSLANRRLLLDRLRQAMARAEREKHRLALLFIDLDKFKPINDELGHETGDRLLQAAAARMESCLRPYDTAARIGGDEFVILLSDLMNVDDALTVAERVREALDSPFVMENDLRLSISASIGVALYPDHAVNERDLMRVGDEAMYRAKKAGRNQVEIISTETALFPSDEYGSVSDGSLFRLDWKPAFACGDDAIDREHQSLFQMANRVLNLAMLPGAEHPKLRSELDRLLREVVGHFKHEESVLEEKGYDKLEAHADKHRSLLDRAGEIRRHVDLNAMTLRELVDFLAVEVIAQHMLTDDRDYFPFIRSSEPDESSLGVSQTQA